MRTLIRSALLIVLWSGAAFAEERSANKVIWFCKNYVEAEKPLNHFTSGLCAGIVSTLFYVSQNLDPAQRFCPPVGATNGQGVRVVVKFVEQHPERMHENFDGLALEALKEAWPCR